MSKMIGGSDVGNTARLLSRRHFLGGVGQFAGATAFGGLLTSLVGTTAHARFLPDSDAVVQTTAGTIRGGIVDGVHIFRGVPYGAPTGGKGRFMPSAPPKGWSGTRDTLEYGDSCPQTPYNLEKPAGIAYFTPFFSQGQSEDCLSLNVWTPAINEGGKRPVLVWLHGGGFSRGSGAGSAYEGTNMVRRGDAVVVTVNHRLNVFGYTHLGGVLGDEFESSGNVGMLDIVQALQWVHDNIANFGGDPNNVLIFGESGGGAKVSTLLAMPAAKGLFHRAVIQSGPSLTVGDPDDGTQAAKFLLEELGLTASQVDELRAVPAEKLLAAQGVASAKAGAAGIRAFRPVLGKDIPAHPFDPVASEISRDVPILIGTNKHESTLFLSANKGLYELDDAGLSASMKTMVGDDAEEVIATYRKAMPNETPSGIYFTASSDRRTRLYSIRLAERKHAQGGAPVYMYRFDWESPAWEGRFRAAHAFEIPFVFDNAQLSDEITGGTPDAVALAAKMSDAWLAFARTGNPSHPGLPDWPAYTSGTRATMTFNDTCETVNDPGGAERLLWERLDAQS